MLAAWSRKPRFKTTWLFVSPMAESEKPLLMELRQATSKQQEDVLNSLLFFLEFFSSPLRFYMDLVHHAGTNPSNSEKVLMEIHSDLINRKHDVKFKKSKQRTSSVNDLITSPH